MSFLGEFWAYLAGRKTFWLLPIFAVIVIVYGLILSQGTPLEAFRHSRTRSSVAHCSLTVTDCSSAPVVFLRERSA